LDQATQTKLIELALTARGNGYAPYSQFQVGAAVLTASGESFAGCNVENASYGLTICAERAAVCAAVAAGRTTIAAVAVAASGGASPCGACRQVLSEFGSAMEIVLVDADDPTRVRVRSLDKLLPEQFGDAALK
jgi:cytidine deaminase